MSLAAALVLVLQPQPAAAREAVPVLRVVAVRGTATAEIVRAGRAGGDQGAGEVVPQRRRLDDGRVLAEFR